MTTSTKVRIDKWLWAIRFFKTRTLATDACSGGKVKVNEINAKPSTNIKIGDLVKVKKNHILYELKVKGIVEKRVGAPIALECYDNLTPPEELAKFENWFLAGKPSEIRERGSGRPTKKERREIDTFKTIHIEEE